MKPARKFPVSSARLWIAVSLLPVLTLGMSNALADCERGVLDAMYCDEDGDLVADRPDDKSEWVNPDTLIFAYTPVEDPAIYSDIWQPFIDHLEKVTGRDVRFFRRSVQCGPGRSYA